MYYWPTINNMWKQYNNETKTIYNYLFWHRAKFYLTWITVTWYLITTIIGSRDLTEITADSRAHALMDMEDPKIPLQWKLSDSNKPGTGMQKPYQMWEVYIFILRYIPSFCAIYLPFEQLLDTKAENKFLG